MARSCRPGPHKFTLYGFVGAKSPTCVHCGAPRPKPLTETEHAEYEDLMRSLGRTPRKATA